jgi:hypothetical protein
MATLALQSLIVRSRGRRAMSSLGVWVSGSQFLFFAFGRDPQDRDWYLDEYLQYPAPTVAKLEVPPKRGSATTI